MFLKLLKNSDPKRILVISQTNIGDVVLTCPVIDILRQDFPKAKIDVVVGPKAVSLFEDNPCLSVKEFNKRQSFFQSVRWFLDLYWQHYDCVVDLRRTALGLFLMPKYATPLWPKVAAGHKRDMHLARLREVYEYGGLSKKRFAIAPTEADEKFFDGSIVPSLEGKNFVVIAAGAADSAKRWLPKSFAEVADYLSKDYKVVFVGDLKDAEIIDDIQSRMTSKAISLAGKINLRQLAFVLSRCRFAITHDSGVMHLASYMDVPIIALWGPTPREKYAPWSKKSVVVHRNEYCPRCYNPKALVTHNCMAFIKPKDVYEAIDTLNEKT